MPAAGGGLPPRAGCGFRSSGASQNASHLCSSMICGVIGTLRPVQRLDLLIAHPPEAGDDPELRPRVGRQRRPRRAFATDGKIANGGRAGLDGKPQPQLAIAFTSPGNGEAVGAVGGVEARLRVIRAEIARRGLRADQQRGERQRDEDESRQTFHGGILSQKNKKPRDAFRHRGASTRFEVLLLTSNF